MIRHWSCRHFSQANPRGVDQDNAAALLRRVAESIDSLEKGDVQDITFHTEITADGPWHSMTVYFSEGSGESQTD